MGARSSPSTCCTIVELFRLRERACFYQQEGTPPLLSYGGNDRTNSSSSCELRPPGVPKRVVSPYSLKPKLDMNMLSQTQERRYSDRSDGSERTTALCDALGAMAPTLSGSGKGFIANKNKQSTDNKHHNGKRSSFASSSSRKEITGSGPRASIAHY
jgi:hypothetical protein